MKVVVTTMADASVLPLVIWPDGSPDGTWVCGCGEVEILLKKYGLYHGECYCVNCQVQVKVAKSKQKGDYNRFSPDTGCRWITQALGDNVQFVKGYDKLTFFRCAVTAPGESTGTNYLKVYKDNCGEEFKEVIKFHNIITECCGTLVGICNPGHPEQIDFDNPWRVKGWQPCSQKERVVFDAVSGPKIGLAWNGNGLSTGIITGDACTCRLCCEISKMCCCGCCVTTCLGPACSFQRVLCHRCCPCFCGITTDPKFMPAPMDCTEHCGKSMEYINDPQFLRPKADPPAQATMVGSCVILDTE